MHEIYDTVPFEVKSSNNNDLKTFLQENNGSFYTARNLSEMFGYKKSNTFVELRKAIAELIEIEGCPIIAHSKGFGWATHPNMIHKYVDGLRARMQGIQRRIEALISIAGDMNGD